MMIGPEAFYEYNLKGKNVEETKKIIRSLKRRINELKLSIEKERFYPKEIYISPSDDVQLWCNRLYLDRAILYLESLGTKYEYSPKEKRCIEFNENIEKLSKITFEIGGFFHGFDVYEFEFTDNTVHKKINEVFNDEISFDFEDKDSFINQLREMHIGEWKSYYDPSRFGVHILDGTQWSVKFEFSNGTKTVEKSGSNDYPYNFEKLLEIFGIDNEK